MSAAKSAEWGAKATIAACVLVLVVAGVYGAQLRQGRETRSTEGHASSTTVVLLDLTDPFTAEQRVALRHAMATLVEELRPHERLELWSLADYPEGPLRREFDVLVPSRDAGWLTDNPRLVREQFDATASRPLLHIADSLASSTQGSSTTPLLEALGELAALGPQLGPRRLVVASDLLQNDAAASVYRRSLAEPRVLLAEPHLAGVEVRLWYLTRHRDLPYLSDAQRREWRAYFTRCGAASVTLERL